jgi:beta-galactosidase
MAITGAHLIVTDPIHIARHGTFVTTPDLENTYTLGDYATVDVKTTVANESGAPAPVGVVYRLKDADGTVVASLGSSVDGQSATQTDQTKLRLDHPRLWSPETPYLYTLETGLLVGGKVIDSTRTRFGVRWLKLWPRTWTNATMPTGSIPGSKLRATRTSDRPCTAGPFCVLG